ncbi:interleukin-17F-like [Gastrophryne carolinensis]
MEEPHFLALLLLFIFTTLVTSHSLAAQLKKGGCPPNKDMIFPSTIKVSLNTSGQFHTQMGDIRRRSISPWDYSHDVNNNRIPTIIAEARCRSKGCINSEGNEDDRFYSIPIKQEILVLQREIKGCVPVFKLEKKLVTVGCTCVQPNEQSQSLFKG